MEESCKGSALGSGREHRAHAWSDFTARSLGQLAGKLIYLLFKAERRKKKKKEEGSLGPTPQSSRGSSEERLAQNPLQYSKDCLSREKSRRSLAYHVHITNLSSSMSPRWFTYSPDLPSRLLLNALHLPLPGARLCTLPCQPSPGLFHQDAA